MPQSKKIKLTSLTTEQKELLAVKAADLLAQMASQAEIAAKLNMSESSARRLVHTDACKEALAEIVGYSKTQAKAHMASQQNVLMPKAMKGLKAALDKGNVEGIKLVLKAFGVVDEKNVSEEKETSLTVVLPGSAREEKNVDADYKKLSSE